MSRFLPVFNSLILILGVLIAAAGYFNAALHPVYGFLYAIIFIGATVLSMFHFIITGASIKRWVEQYSLDQSLYQKTRIFKKQLFPAIFLSAVFMVTAGIYGGAVNAQMTPAWLHSLLAFLSLSLFGYSSVILRGILPANTKLYHYVLNLAEIQHLKTDHVSKD